MSHLLIAEAHFYEDIANLLFVGAKAVLDAAGVTYERTRVPGCFELPAVVAMGHATGKYQGFVALGCVIRGETTHYDYVCSESARGLNDLAMRFHLAIGYGIITAENHKQAEARANGSKRDVGGKAAQACLAMIACKKQFHLK